MTQVDIKRLMNCTVEQKPSGWYLTFPHNRQAGLILSDRTEQIEFLNDCGIPAIDPDLDRIFRMFKVHQCSTFWYAKACEVKEPF